MINKRGNMWKKMRMVIDWQMSVSMSVVSKSVVIPSWNSLYMMAVTYLYPPCPYQDTSTIGRRLASTHVYPDQ